MAYGGFGGGSYAAAQAQAFGDPGFGGCHVTPVAPRGFGGGFALIVVLFILLIIVGATVVY